MTLKVIAGLVAGGLIGLGFHRLVGCASGACPITSSPWASMIYGMIIGVFVAVA